MTENNGLWQPLNIHYLSGRGQENSNTLFKMTTLACIWVIIKGVFYLFVICLRYNL